MRRRADDGVRDRLNAIHKVAQGFQSWKPAGQVLTSVRAHPTIFPLVDRATGVGGWPLQRIALVHGPSNHGKTQFCHGLGLSFLNAANFYAFIDAEFTTPVEWLTQLMNGQEANPGFVAMRPSNYEETTKAVREFAEKINDAKAKSELPEDTTGLLVVDSIRKLVPKNLLAKIEKEEGGIDGASGRGAMMKAALNAQWMDELVPLLYHANLSMIFISRETERQLQPGQHVANEPGAGQDYRVTGGKALIYESSIVARITRTWVKQGQGEDSDVIGERHKVAITKTKIAEKDDKVVEGYFHTSNGVLVPSGFDRARDVIELALDAGIVKKSGAWLTWDTQKWNGINAAVKALTDDVGLLDTLEGEAR